jgi:hypothetical protein
LIYGTTADALEYISGLEKDKELLNNAQRKKSMKPDPRSQCPVPSSIQFVVVVPSSSMKNR